MKIFFQTEVKKKWVDKRELLERLVLNVSFCGFGKLCFETNIRVLDAKTKGYFFYIKFISQPPKNLDENFKFLTYGIQIITYNQRVKIGWFTRRQKIQRIG